jgi:hypothetical protein
MLYPGNIDKSLAAYYERMYKMWQKKKVLEWKVEEHANDSYLGRGIEKSEVTRHVRTTCWWLFCGGQRSGGKGLSFKMLISAENREFGNDKQWIARNKLLFLA